MLKSTNWLIMEGMICLLIACKKNDNLPNMSISKVTVINAIVDGGTLKATVSPIEKSWNSIENKELLYYGASNTFIVPSGFNFIDIVSLSDTTRVLYKQKANLMEGERYTLYLSGSMGTIDTLLQKERDFPINVPLNFERKVTSTDSIVNVRFINLSSNGPVVDFSIRNSFSKEASALSYQEFSDFKKCSARDYTLTIDVNNSANDQLLTSYALNTDYFRFKNIAVVVIGTYGTPGYRVTALSY